MAPLLYPRKPTTQDAALLSALYNALNIIQEKIEDSEIKFSELSSLSALFSKEIDNGIQSWGDGFEQLGGEWWEMAIRHGVKDPINDLFYKLFDARAASNLALDAQSTIRQSINTLSRPFLRRLTVMDLPDEILLEIFELVEGSSVSASVTRGYTYSGLADIKNLRLVCRRFSDLSSRCLIRVVPVSLRQSSIANLERIARHPTISRGVREVQVLFESLSVSFLDEFDDFAVILADELAIMIETFEDNGRGITKFAGNEDAYHAILTHARDVSAILARITSQNDEESDSGDDGSGSEVGDEDIEIEREETEIERRQREIEREEREIEREEREIEREERETEKLETALYLGYLQKLHAERNARVQEERSLVETGRFTQALVSALKRMPGARVLRLGEKTVRNKSLISETESVWKRIESFALQPFDNYYRKRKGIEIPDFESTCIGQIIDAVEMTGVKLESLDIVLGTWGKMGSIMHNLKARPTRSSGIQRLKRFRFACKHDFNDEEVNEVEQFCKLFTDTSTLQKLNLSFGPRMDDDAPWVNFTRIIGHTRSRSQLKHLSVSHAAISNPTKLLSLLPTSMDSIQLHDVRLADGTGTWKRTLDLLSQMTCMSMDDPTRSFYLQFPHGAECDTMTRKDYIDIFVSDDWDWRDESKAMRYVMLRRHFPEMRNPILELEEREAESETNSTTADE